MEITRSLVMPVSGAFFANQVGLSRKLVEVGYVPNVILGTSGGCIAGVVLLICGVNEVKCRDSYLEFCAKQREVLFQLDSDWYRTQWSTSSLMSSGMALKEGSLFNRGNGEVLVKDLDIDLNSQPEMWIGTRCKCTATSQLFCTRSKKSAKIKLQDAIYLDGDVKTATKASIASCALPTIVPGVPIGRYNYCDGGVSYASPLGPCSEVFADDGNVSYHVVYISPARYSSKDDPHTQEIEDDDTWNQIASSMTGMGVRHLHIPDRNNGIRMVGPNAIKTVGRGERALIRALKLQRRSTRSFIELAPVDAVHVNFLQMKKGEALRAAQRAYEADFTVRHWYV